jgi:predicted small secreted protein
MAKAKKLISAVVTALTACPTCRGTGKEPHYKQLGNEILKGRAVVGYTDCTAFKACDTCKGSGRPR